MKKLKWPGIAIIILMWSSTIFAQVQVPNTFAGLSKIQADSVKNEILNYVYSNPDLLNDAFAKYVGGLKVNSNTSVYDYMRDLNFKFKTFQADGQSPALGFEYKYDNSWTKTRIDGSHSFSQSYNVNLDGNVAFKKIYNPDNFLESKFFYNGTFLWGGKAKKNTPEQIAQLKDYDKQIIKAGNANDIAKLKALYQQSNELVSLTNQYYVGINGFASFESNQDFSKRQFVPGVLVNLGAKAWDKTEALRYFNIPDYPFALMRLITGTDDSFNILGASFPSALVGLDYVIPDQDTLRKAVTGALNPFARLRLEAAFKTKFAVVDKQVIYFSADYRWYHQLGASQALENAGIAHFNYFTCNLAANNGFFVSYTTGRLPFDVKSSNVYGLGFNYNLGNWK